VALKVTSHVGRDLLASAASFKTEQSVAWEYVVNSLQYVDDGVTPNVQVIVNQREKVIEIHDNGRGMTDNDLLQFFTMHGENIDRLRGRPGRGKFGTGKAAAFGIGRTLTVDTRRNGIRNRVRLTREAVDDSSGKEIPLEWQVKNESTPLANGTSIAIERIALPRLLTPPIIEYIERHLQIYRSKMPAVAVNEHVCQIREPEIENTFEFRPSTEQAELLGPIVLRLKLSRAPLPQAEMGVAVTAGLGNLVAIETGGIETKEFGNYLFGDVDCLAIETYQSPIEPYDPTRSLQLNVRHPVCAVLVSFIASKLEEVRLGQVRKLQEARKTEQARRLASEANRIADILNRDFQNVVSRLQGIRAAAAKDSGALGRFGTKAEGGEGAGAWVDGLARPGDLEESDRKPRTTGGANNREAPDLPRRGSENSEGSDSVDPLGGEGQRKKPRGGFKVDFRHSGEKSYRSDYDRPTLTILINLDHPVVRNALSAGGTEDISFKRLSYELAFTEYSLALGWEMAERDPDIPADDLLFEVRASLNRVASAAAGLYSA